MNSELRDRIDQIRAVLADRPDGPVLGDFPPGRPVDDPNLPPGLADVIALTDGPRAGDLVLRKAETLGDQYLALEQAHAIPDPDAWVYIGTLNDEPLLANKAGEVWFFPDTGVIWQDSTAFEKLADSPEDLVLTYMLGDGYLDIIPSDDDWSDLLIDLGWADDSGDADS